MSPAGRPLTNVTFDMTSRDLAAATAAPKPERAVPQPAIGLRADSLFPMPSVRQFVIGSGLLAPGWWPCASNFGQLTG